MPDKKNAPHPVRGACAATIKQHIYMFGGWDLKSADTTNDLWKLSSKNGCFNWSKIEFPPDVRLPSPRFDHSGWEYANCLWVFGGNRFETGRLPLQAQYLHDDVDFVRKLNNQLFVLILLDIHGQIHKVSAQYPVPDIATVLPSSTTMFG